MVRIINLKNYKLKEGEVLFKVDRSSPVGNPFIMHKESERDDVCNRYEEYFSKNITTNKAMRVYVSQMIKALKAGNDVALGCWCYPKRCHAETIVKLINSIYKGI
jgi:hypothetical protein